MFWKSHNYEDNRKISGQQQTKTDKIKTNKKIKNRQWTSVDISSKKIHKWPIKA